MDKAHLNILSAIELSRNYDEHRLLESYLILSLIKQKTGKLDSALLIIQPGIIKATELKNDTLLGMAYHSLGVNFQFSGSSDLALENYLIALEINERIGRDEEAIRQLNNIGLIYRDEGEYEKALEYLDLSIELCKKIKDRHLQMYSYGNAGYIFMKQGLFDEALERFDEVLVISEELNDPTSRSTGHYLIADVMIQLKEFDSSEYHAKEALSLASSANFVLGKIFSYRVLSDKYRLTGELIKAQKAATKARRLMENHSTLLYYDDVMKSLYKSEYELGNYKRAIDVQLELSEHKDSLNEIRIKEKIANSEFKYQLLQNEQENTLLKIENETNVKTKVFAYIVAVLLGLLGLLSFVGYRKSKNYNESLELAIDERTKELQQSNRELERFTYITAHDLKEPSRNIVSYSTLLNKKLENKDYSSIAEYASMLSKNSMQLYNLIDQIMKFSSVKHGDQIEKTAVDLAIVIEEIKDLLSDTISSENVKISYNNLPTINGDKSLLLILFKNLIENAIKYNDKLVKKIEIGLRNSDGETIYVTDNGIGVESEYKDSIFEMFKKLHPKHEYDGSGLGLSICQRIASLHDYKMSVESNPEEGSTFLLSL